MKVTLTPYTRRHFTCKAATYPNPCPNFGSPRIMPLRVQIREKKRRRRRLISTSPVHRSYSWYMQPIDIKLTHELSLSVHWISIIIINWDWDTRHSTLTCPTDVVNKLTMRSWATATTLIPLMSIIRCPTRRPPRSAIPPRSRLHIYITHRQTHTAECRALP